MAKTLKGTSGLHWNSRNVLSPCVTVCFCSTRPISCKWPILDTIDLLLDDGEDSLMSKGRGARRIF